MYAPYAGPTGLSSLRWLGGVTIALTVALATGCATTPAADDPVQVKLNDIDARVTRIEHVISNQSLVELAQHLDAVQADLRQLRGRIEELEYNQEAMRKQQRDLYNDLDKRVAAMGGGSSGVAAAGGSSGAGGSTGADGIVRPGGSGVGSGSSAVGAGPGATAGAAAGAGAAIGAAAAGSAGSASGSSSGGAGSSEEQTVYAQSFDALKAGSYSVAITGFKDFVVNYPNSPLAENAQYWLGEAYYVTHDLDAASVAFRNVAQKWPNSRKTPDALLKLGYTQLDQKKTAEGRTTLSQVVQKYPGTEAARLANEKLQRAPAPK
jgi:tol-pal system protein YbgF